MGEEGRLSKQGGLAASGPRRCVPGGEVDYSPILPAALQHETNIAVARLMSSARCFPAELENPEGVP